MQCIPYSETIARGRYGLDCELKKDTPYLALMGELWSAFCEDLKKNNCINTTIEQNSTIFYNEIQLYVLTLTSGIIWQ